MVRRTMLGLILLVGLALDPASESWAVQSQKDQVCQGSYGGGCGTAPSGPRQPREPSARDIAIERHNEGVHAYNAGIDASRKGDYAAALDYYQQALAILPRDLDCLTAIPRTRGTMAYKSGDYATALDYYQQALAIAPRDKHLLSAVATIRGVMAAHQGEAAWKRNDIAAALAFYRQAFAYDPDPTWRDNIALAQKELQRLEATTHRQQQTEQSLSTLAETAKMPAGSSAPSALGFKTVDTRPGSEVTGTGIFGSASNPANPQLDPSPSAAAVAVNSATDHLTSAVNSGAAANDAAISQEKAKSTADCAFGASACAPSMPVPIHKEIVQLPSGVPAGLAKDTRYQKLQGQKAELDQKYQKLDTRLIEVRQHQASGQGDQGALVLEASRIKDEMTAVRSEKGDVDRKMEDLSVTFEEETHPAKKPRSSPTTVPPPPTQ
jgi:tetratricopeptide (TPR) repeat protein